MTNKVAIYRKIFNEAYKYLLSLYCIDESMLDKHLSDWEKRKPGSVQDLLSGMLGSLSNKRDMQNTIGPIEKLGPYLEDFIPSRIIEKYGDDWKKLFNTIKNNYEPLGRMMIDNPRSYWVIFCKSVISASHFLSQFSNLKEFDKFVSQFYLNEYTRVALPLLLEKEIFGLGFVLACDFLKENGYPKFIKPDRHIKAIFHGIGISKSKSAYDIFKDVIRFSEDIKKLPYSVDKLFWLVGSGNFYLDKVKINTNRDEFIERINHEFRDKLQFYGV
ncbi:MAG: hypothetical protein JW732_09405 [Dehalococcoidia bacterium]|nr:hypothetical protein [Dehalococcoidia bacterium]